jgi:hypothetical protein
MKQKEMLMQLQLEQQLMTVKHKCLKTTLMSTRKRFKI